MTSSKPTVVGVIAFVGAFLALVFGVTLIYDGDAILGAVLLIAATAFVVVPVVWAIRNR